MRDVEQTRRYESIHFGVVVVDLNCECGGIVKTDIFAYILPTNTLTFLLLCNRRLNFFTGSLLARCYYGLSLLRTLSWGPFLGSPGNVSGPKSDFQIEIQRIRAWVLANKLLLFVSLTDSFIMLNAKLLKPLSCM